MCVASTAVLYLYTSGPDSFIARHQQYSSTTINTVYACIRRRKRGPNTTKFSFNTKVGETAIQQPAQQYVAKFSVVVLIVVVKTARHVGCSCTKKTHNGSCLPGLVLGYTGIPSDVHTAVSSGLRVHLVTWYTVLSRFDCEPVSYTHLTLPTNREV